MDVRVGLWRKLSAEELMLLNCGVGEDSWESLGPQRDTTGDQSWVFIGRTDVEAETSIFWPPDAKSWLIGKDPDAGKDWGQEKGMTENEMVGWHHWLDAHEFGWTPGVGDGQGGLTCWGSWGLKESDTTEWLNWTEWLIHIVVWHNLVYQFYCCCSVTKPCLTLCNYMDCSSVLHYLPECDQTLFQWVNSSHEVSKVLELQL